MTGRGNLGHVNDKRFPDRHGSCPRVSATGLASGPLVLVFGDLQPGDEIASRGTDEIRAGSEVRVPDARAPAL